MRAASSTVRKTPALLALLGLGVIASARAAPPPGAAVFGALPEESQPVISPDGHRLAWYERKDPPIGVVIFDIDARRNLRVLTPGDGGTVSSLEWQSNDTLLMTVHIGGSHGGPGPRGATFTPDLYACAVSIDGVADLPAYVTALLPASNGPLGHTISSSARALVEKRIGKPSDAGLKARSPINAVAAIRAPVLIMYTGNAGVAAAQSSGMARTLSAAGKDVSLATLPADAWSNDRVRAQVFQELERFLGRHLQTD